MSIRLRVQKGQVKAELEIEANGDSSSLSTVVAAILEKLIGDSESKGDLKIVDKILSKNDNQVRNISTKYQRIRQIILTHLVDSWFTSADVKELYEAIFKEPIRPSTVSTYLRRMEEEGFLTSRKLGRYIEFRVAESALPIVSVSPRSHFQAHDQSEI